jgi:NADH dehydrogenase/putative oxidoreductase
MSRPANLQANRSNPTHLAAVAIRWASDVSRIAERTVEPPLDVFIRLWLAGIFWASGMVKLQSWTTAL